MNEPVKTELMNNMKLICIVVLLLLNGAYASEPCRPIVNHKFTRAQVKLTSAWALVGPGVDTLLVKSINIQSYTPQLASQLYTKMFLHTCIYLQLLKVHSMIKLNVSMRCYCASLRQKQVYLNTNNASYELQCMGVTLTNLQLCSYIQTVCPS